MVPCISHIPVLTILQLSMFLSISTHRCRLYEGRDIVCLFSVISSVTRTSCLALNTLDGCWLSKGMNGGSR